MTSAKIFYFSCLSFILGIAFCAFFSPPAWLAGFFVLAGASLAVSNWPKKKHNFFWSVGKKRVLSAGFILLALGLSFWRSLNWQEANFSTIVFWNDSREKVEISGWVEREKTKTENSRQFVMVGEKISLPGGAKEVSGKILLVMPAFAALKPGDEISVKGKLETPKDLEENPAFSYQKYLAKDGLYSSMVFPVVEKTGWRNEKPVSFFLFKIKEAFEERISRVLPQPQQGFLNGILFGEKGGMSPALKENFARTGTSHLVALSGFNITIITQALAAFFLFWGVNRKKVFWLAFLSIWLFVLMVGADSSIVRAAIMGLLFLYAKKENRLYGARNAILLAGVLMLWFKPNDLMLDIGFQLSFLATLGLVYLTPVFAKGLKKIPEFFGFKEALVSTLAAQVFVLPFLIFYFQSLSLISPLVNVLVLPVIPLTMLFGFLAGALGFLAVFLGQIAGWLAWAFLTYELGVIEFFGRFSLASVSLTLPFIYAVSFFYYAALFTLVFWWRKKEHREFVERRDLAIAGLK